MTYKEHLKNIKGYTDATIEIYCKYALLLEKNNYDYTIILNNMKGNSNNTKRIALSAIKNYYKFTKDERADEITLPKKEYKIQEWISYPQYKLFLSNINSKTRMGIMKRVIIRLLFETGIRSRELLEIRKTDIDGNKIKINGKGNYQRIVKISEWLLSDLNDHLKNIYTERIFSFTYKNLYKKIESLDKTKRTTPHMFRRGYARYLYSKDVSIYDISLSMGHNDVNTTASYIKKSSSDIDLSMMF